jgi:hypothetical protein
MVSDIYKEKKYKFENINGFSATILATYEQ